MKIRTIFSMCAVVFLGACGSADIRPSAQEPAGKVMKGPSPQVQKETLQKVIDKQAKTIDEKETTNRQLQEKLASQKRHAPKAVKESYVPSKKRYDALAKGPKSKASEWHREVTVGTLEQAKEQMKWHLAGILKEQALSDLSKSAGRTLTLTEQETTLARALLSRHIAKLDGRRWAYCETVVPGSKSPLRTYRLVLELSEPDRRKRAKTLLFLFMTWPTFYKQLSKGGRWQSLAKDFKLASTETNVHLDIERPPWLSEAVWNEAIKAFLNSLKKAPFAMIQEVSKVDRQESETAWYLLEFDCAAPAKHELVFNQSPEEAHAFQVHAGHAGAGFEDIKGEVVLRLKRHDKHHTPKDQVKELDVYALQGRKRQVLPSGFRIRKLTLLGACQETIVLRLKHWGDRQHITTAIRNFVFKRFEKTGRHGAVLSISGPGTDTRILSTLIVQKDASMTTFNLQSNELPKGRVNKLHVLKRFNNPKDKELLEIREAKAYSKKTHAVVAMFSKKRKNSEELPFSYERRDSRNTAFSFKLVGAGEGALIGIEYAQRIYLSYAHPGSSGSRSLKILGSVKTSQLEPKPDSLPSKGNKKDDKGEAVKGTARKS